MIYASNNHFVSYSQVFLHNNLKSGWYFHNGMDNNGIAQYCVSPGSILSFLLETPVVFQQIVCAMVVGCVCEDDGVGGGDDSTISFNDLFPVIVETEEQTNEPSQDLLVCCLFLFPLFFS